MGVSHLPFAFMDRLFDKVFTQAHAVQSIAVEREYNAAAAASGASKAAEKQAPDAIQDILQFWKDKEYFK